MQTIAAYVHTGFCCYAVYYKFAYELMVARVAIGLDPIIIYEHL